MNHSAPGLIGVTSKVIKGLDREHREVLFAIISDYFDGKTDINGTGGTYSFFQRAVTSRHHTSGKVSIYLIQRQK